MEFLRGEVEARYAWDTATVVAMREAKIHAAEKARPIQVAPTSNMLRDYRTIREALRATQPASVMGLFARIPAPWESPDYFPSSAWQAKLAMDAGWRPKPSLHSAAALADYLAGTAHSDYPVSY